jgi:LacI family transcriptional regulator
VSRSRTWPAKKRVTIKDVAKEAEVSITTVSNVLNERTDAMSEETLRRVRQVMRELGYRPNAVARSLVTRHTATLGVVLAEIETPLFLNALSAIEPIARDADYNVLISNAGTAGEEEEICRVLLANQVDGLIFLSVSRYTQKDCMPDLARLNIPVVLVNRAESYQTFDQINWDDTAGVTAAVEHLADLGHRRIAHLCGPAGRRSGENRLRGYRAGLVRHGIPYRPEYVRSGDYTDDPETWACSVRELMDLPSSPTAIIASDDIVAATAIRTLQDCGRRVPGDVSVIGIDDQPFCSYLSPALTTIRLPVVKAGELAVEMILDRISGRRTEAEHVVLPCSLIVRESCGPHQENIHAS